MGGPRSKVRYSLAGNNWELAESVSEGWRFRKLHLGVEEPVGAFARTRWIPAQVPGSVHWDLLRAGLIPDPYFGLDSKAAEWVPQRQWVYRKKVKIPESLRVRPLYLTFEGADYAALVFWDGKPLGRVEGLYGKARFRIENPLPEHLLVVVLEEAPLEPGQLGRTSETQTLKARAGYGWDFGTRLVHLGLCREIYLEPVPSAEIADVSFHTELAQANTLARLHYRVRLKGDPQAAVQVKLICPDGQFVGERERLEGVLEVFQPRLWWPNGMGEQPCYTLRVERGETVWERRIGLREIELSRNPGRPDALPYTFTVNGREVFARGYNWVLPDLMYGRGDLTERYRHLLRLAQESGANLIRCNGVSLVESETFYDLCDELGLMVWQEFTLSSSGTDNLPPVSERFTRRLEAELPHLIREKRHHPSLAVWGGGNELADTLKRPVGLEHPTIARIQALVAEHDPMRPFLPTSPSGPEYDLSEKVARERPQDLHDVHGPWHYRGLEETYRPFHASTALFHSEFGCQGAAYRGTLRRFIPEPEYFPPDDTNPVFVHHGSWWLMRHRVEEVFGLVGDYGTYWRLSQGLQAEVIRYAIHAGRRRSPECAGALVWQLDEPWPNAHNTALVDYYGKPKLAYYAAKKAFRPVVAGLWYATPRMPEHLEFTPEVLSDGPFEGWLRIETYTLEGRPLERLEQRVSCDRTLSLATYARAWAEMGQSTAWVRLKLGDSAGVEIGREEYLFTQTNLEPLRQIPQTRLSATLSGSRLTVGNLGPFPAYWVALDFEQPGFYAYLSDGGFHLLPGEEARLELQIRPRTAPDPDTLSGWPESPIRLELSALNAGPVFLEIPPGSLEGAR